jgi:hypothetical protein
MAALGPPELSQAIDHAARQPFIAAAARQDRDLGALMVVRAIGPRIEAADFDAVTAIIGDREQPYGGRHFEDAPTTVLEDPLARVPRRGRLVGASAAAVWEAHDVAHRTCLRLPRAIYVPMQDLSEGGGVEQAAGNQDFR